MNRTGLTNFSWEKRKNSGINGKVIIAHICQRRMMCLHYQRGMSQSIYNRFREEEEENKRHEQRIIVLDLSMTIDALIEGPTPDVEKYKYVKCDDIPKATSFYDTHALYFVPVQSNSINFLMASYV